MGRGGVHTWFWWRDLKKINRLDDLGIEITLRWKFNKRDVGASTGFIWIRKGAGGEFF
jgi:hypothetical protein